MKISIYIPQFLLFFDDLINFRFIGPQYEFVKIQNITRKNDILTIGHYQQKIKENEFDSFRTPQFVKKKISRFDTHSLFYHKNSSIDFSVNSSYYTISGGLQFMKKKEEMYECEMKIYDMEFYIPKIFVTRFFETMVKNQIFRQLSNDIEYTLNHRKEKKCSSSYTCLNMFSNTNPLL